MAHQNTLFVGDLSIFCSESDLYSLFANYGEIVNVSIKKDSNTNRNLSYGFVRFVNQQSAINALAGLQGYLFHGRSFRIGWAKQRFDNNNMPIDGTTEHNFITSAFAPTNYRRETCQLQISFISNQVQMITTEELLRDIFSVFGPVVDSSIKKSNINQYQGHQSGYGFIHYPDNIEGVEAALHALRTMSNVTINCITYDCNLSHQLYQRLVQLEYIVPEDNSGFNPVSSNYHFTNPIFNRLNSFTINKSFSGVEKFKLAYIASVNAEYDEFGNVITDNSSNQNNNSSNNSEAAGHDIILHSNNNDIIVVNSELTHSLDFGDYPTATAQLDLDEYENNNNSNNNNNKSSIINSSNNNNNNTHSTLDTYNNANSSSSNTLPFTDESKGAEYTLSPEEEEIIESHRLRKQLDRALGSSSANSGSSGGGVNNNNNNNNNSSNNNNNNNEDALLESIDEMLSRSFATDLKIKLVGSGHNTSTSQASTPKILPTSTLSTPMSNSNNNNNNNNINNTTSGGVNSIGSPSNSSNLSNILGMATDKLTSNNTNTNKLLQQPQSLYNNKNSPLLYGNSNNSNDYNDDLYSSNVTTVNAFNPPGFNNNSNHHHHGHLQGGTTAKPMSQPRSQQGHSQHNSHNNHHGNSNSNYYGNNSFNPTIPKFNNNHSHSHHSHNHNFNPYLHNSNNNLNYNSHNINNIHNNQHPRSINNSTLHYNQHYPHFNGSNSNINSPHDHSNIIPPPVHSSRSNHFNTGSSSYPSLQHPRHNNNNNHNNSSSASLTLTSSNSSTSNNMPRPTVDNFGRPLQYNANFNSNNPYLQQQQQQQQLGPRGGGGLGSSRLYQQPQQGSFNTFGSY